MLLRSVRPLAPSSRSKSPHARLVAGYGIALIVLVLDLATKAWIVGFTPLGWSQPVSGFFNLVHAWNTGAAFSFLADAGAWARYALVGIACAVSLWLLVILRRPMPTVERVAYGLVLGGAMGNGIDRALRGHVVDFLDFYWQDWHWPAFNIADIGIVVGAALLVIASFTPKTVPSR